MIRKNKERKKTTSCGGVVWRVSEGGIISLLLIRQFSHSSRWGIPKGHTHEGETLEECAVREIREETGVNVVLGERLADMAATYPNEDKTIVSFLARPVGDDTPMLDDPDSEVADARWFQVHDLPEIIVYQRPMIASAVSSLFKVIEESKKMYQPMGPPEPGLGDNIIAAAGRRAFAEHEETAVERLKRR